MNINPDYSAWPAFEKAGEAVQGGPQPYHVQMKSETSPGGSEEHRFRHPSFGQIAVTRWHGAAKGRFFESNVSANTGISIEIKHAELKRDLSNNWVYGYDTICEVRLSPAQWADLLVNMNTTGVPCTLEHYWDRSGFVRPAYPEDFDNEMSRIEKEFKAAIQALELIDPADSDVIKEVAAKLPKKHQDMLMNAIGRITSKVKDRIPYIRDMAEESIQRTVTQAKSEVANYVTLSLAQHGMQHLQASAPTIADGALPKSFVEQDEP